jgi:hypothetical protein
VGRVVRYGQRGARAGRTVWGAGSGGLARGCRLAGSRGGPENGQRGQLFEDRQQLAMILAACGRAAHPVEEHLGVVLVAKAAPHLGRVGLVFPQAEQG